MPKAKSRAAVETNGEVTDTLAGPELILAHEVTLVAIDSPRYDPENARLHPEESLEAIKASLARYGQRKAIVVNRRTNHVEAGNGTLAAARELGWRRIAVVYADDDELTALGYGLADNATAEKSRWDEERRMIQALRAESMGEIVPGFSSRQLAAMRLKLEDAGSERRDVFPVERIVDACYDHFKANGFPYPRLPLHICMQEINDLANADPGVLAGTDTGIGVADTYHAHRWHAAAEGKRSPLQTFENDEWFRTSILVTLEMQGRLRKDFVEGLRFSRGTQPCSNFRPGYALFVYRRYGIAGGTVLDTSMGYGGRLVGFMASNLGRYVGVDPSADSCRSNAEMAEAMGFSDRVETYQLPAEDVPVKEVAGQCDLCFTSPPYFRKEHYTDEPTQSWIRYGGDGEAWRKGFLIPMMCLQYAALKPGKHAVINIADVELKGKTYPLVKWTMDAAKRAGFTHVATEEYPLGRVPGAKDTNVNSEPVLIFRKGD